MVPAAERQQTRTQAQLEGWPAEEDGLKDALLNRDRTYQYRDSPPCEFDVFERYAMGLEDGRALMRLERVTCMWHPAADGTRV